MNTKAIERIKGFCCEVKQEQWEELVRVADSVGCKVGIYVRTWTNEMNKSKNFAGIGIKKDCITVFTGGYNSKLIPYPDFLAKLKGEEKWEPKAGEMVEFSDKGILWWEREFIGESRGKYVGWTSDGDVHAWAMCRPACHTITRAEAESQLGKRIID
jgi:hypothetical protein